MDELVIFLLLWKKQRKVYCRCPKTLSSHSQRGVSEVTEETGGSEWKWSARWHGFCVSLSSKVKWAYRTFSGLETHWRRVSSQDEFASKRAVHPITLRKWSFVSPELKWRVGQWERVSKGAIFHLSALMYLRPFGFGICGVIMALCREAPSALLPLRSQCSRAGARYSEWGEWPWATAITEGNFLICKRTRGSVLEFPELRKGQVARVKRKTRIRAAEVSLRFTNGLYAVDALTSLRRL